MRRLTAFLLVCLFAFSNAQSSLAHPNEPSLPAASRPSVDSSSSRSSSLLPDSLQLVGTPDRQAAVLSGPNDRLQLLALATDEAKQLVDLTRTVKYAVQPADVVHIDASGRARPLKDGEAKVTVTFDSQSASTLIRVQNFNDPPPINFSNHIVPLFTKFGCNAGGCHGKSGGQNGFALSLLGFEPDEDYQYLVKESRGRRVFPAAPENSLLLQKATGEIPHGGGAQMAKSSYEYDLLKQWIGQGMPFGSESDPVLESIEVFPASARLNLESDLQLKVTATYSDGSTSDVTNQSQFTPNNTDLANATEGGIVETLGRAGQVAVMVRFQDKATAFLASIPLGQKLTDLPPAQNFIDTHVFAKLRELGLPASELANDSVFIRRVTLDIAGRLPTVNETEAFLKSDSQQKRALLIDRLLESDDHANYFAQKWTSILRNRVVQNEPRTGNFLFHDWIRQAISENRPYDQWVNQLITASGDVRINPAVNWHLKFQNLEERAEDTAQIFLGQRIQCAKCHHHPFEKWSQEDYWRFAAFYSNVNQKSGRRIYSRRGKAQARNTKDRKLVTAAGLSAEPIDDFQGDARIKLAEWMTAPSNPFFARMLVNRYWKHFLGIGIVDPEDDLRVTNPPSNPELLDALEKSFVESNFDMKQLIRNICNSSTYQLSAVPNEHNKLDRQSFSRFNPRRLPAEVMLDSIDSFLGADSRFRGLPAGTTATRIPDHGMANNSFLDTFGRPAGASACECERSGEITMAQCLQLLNSNDMYQKLSSPTVNEMTKKSSDDLSEIIRQLHLKAFSREPRPKEIAAYTAYYRAAKPGQENQAIQDIMWTIVNTKEFLFNH